MRRRGIRVTTDDDPGVKDLWIARRRIEEIRDEGKNGCVLILRTAEQTSYRLKVHETIGEVVSQLEQEV